MDVWDDDFLHEEERAYMRFGKDDLGDFHFGHIQGEIDYRATLRDGLTAVEFSWDGLDEGHPTMGRAWAILEDKDTLRGMFFIHMGDESEFVAKRE